MVSADEALLQFASWSLEGSSAPLLITATAGNGILQACLLCVDGNQQWFAGPRGAACIYSVVTSNVFLTCVF